MAQAASPGQPPPQSSKQAPQKKKEKAPPKETGPLINLGFLNIPVIKDNTPVAYIGLHVTLEGKDPMATQILRDHAPEIYSSFFVDLYILSHILWGVEDALNMTSLKKRFETICTQLLGANFLQNILLQKKYIKELK